MTDQEAVIREDEFSESLRACERRGYLQPWFVAHVEALLDDRAALVAERDQWKREAYALADVLPDG